MTPTSGKCAKCSKSTPTRCAGCSEGLDSNLLPCQTFYCSKECQKADWESHKPLCNVANARKELLRGAELIQDIYYAFREIAFDTEPKQINVVNGKIHMQLAQFRDGLAGDNEWPFYPFPKAALPKAEDQKALLVWNNCEDSVAYMHELLQKVLKGLINNNKQCSPIEQRMVMKDEHKSIIRHFSDGSIENSRFQHLVLNVGLKKGNDEHFIIDIAGAQHRQYRAMTPQKEYVKLMMATKEFEQFGYYNRRWKNAVKYQNDPVLVGADMRAMVVHHELANVINTAVGDWEKKSGSAMSKMLRQKEDAFRSDKAALIESIKNEMRLYLDYLKSRPQIFGSEKVKVQDLPKWKDEKFAQPNVPQDMENFMEEQKRKGTKIINFPDL